MAARGGLHRRTSLISAQYTRVIELPAVMELDEPPPVPPKDKHDNSKMDKQQTPSGPSSGSKRKRGSHGVVKHDALDADPNTHSPKRPRARLDQKDDLTDATPYKQQSVRRKRGSVDLSNLNLRHAASQSEIVTSSARASKFQEGSLKDAPSQKPPSVFTRMSGRDNADLDQVDQLMANYHDGSFDDSPSIDREAQNHSRADSRKSENGAFFRFGRSIAANFHPISLWNRMWNESKEELTRQNVEDADRKAKIKRDAEAKYAQMKADGQIPAVHVHRASEPLSTPRDSGIAFDDLGLSRSQQPLSSIGSQLVDTQDDLTSQSENEMPETGHKTLRTIRSRLHLKRPSLSNIRNDLKRVRSDLSLRNSIAHRASSSSLSPVKPDIPDSALRSSQSKYDLKKQNRLSKRVSDLENKLERARRELDEALIDASPMPHLGSRFERFTPASSSKRPRFTPGALPSLPSERLLFPELIDSSADQDTPVKTSTSKTDPRQGNCFDVEDEETVRASRHNKQKPTHVSAIFKTTDESLAKLPHSVEKREEDRIFEDIQHSTDDRHHIENPAITSSELAEMDPNSIPYPSLPIDDEPAESADYSALDNKLKQLDASYKASKKTVTKKRKSTRADDDDKAYQPDGTFANDTDSDDEKTPRKKSRKSAGKGKTTVQSKQANMPSRTKSRSKIPRKVAASASPTREINEPGSIDHPTSDMIESIRNASGPATELPETSHLQFDAEGHALEPLYEEEEEFAPNLGTSATTTHAESTQAQTPVASAPTPYLRSRSASPRKRGRSVQPAPDEVVLTRAARVAQVSRSRGRAASPSRGQGTKPARKTVEDVVQVVSEEEGGSEKAKVVGTTKERYEWPDDIF